MVPDVTLQSCCCWCRRVQVAVIKSLTTVIRNSTQKTTQGLLIDLKAASDELLKYSTVLLDGRTFISLVAGCELMVRYVTRTTSIHSADEVSGGSGQAAAGKIDQLCIVMWHNVGDPRRVRNRRRLRLCVSLESATQ